MLQMKERKEKEKQKKGGDENQSVKSHATSGRLVLTLHMFNTYIYMYIKVCIGMCVIVCVCVWICVCLFVECYTYVIISCPFMDLMNFYVLM